jgi:hypothetical protein
MEATLPRSIPKLRDHDETLRLARADCDADRAMGRFRDGNSDRKALDSIMARWEERLTSGSSS